MTPIRRKAGASNSQVRKFCDIARSYLLHKRPRNSYIEVFRLDHLRRMGVYFGGGLSPPGRILPVAIVIGMNESMCRENAVLSIEVDLAQLPTIKSASFAEECWMKSLGTSPRCYRSGLR